MKKIITILSALLLMTGCNANKTDNADTSLTACTSFYAIYDFAEAVGGDKVNVINMVPTGTEPHDWEPSAHDMLTVSDADVLFYNGLGMESWVDSVKSSISKSDVEYVELSEGLADETLADPHIWLDPEKASEMVNKIAETFAEMDTENADYYRQRAADLTDRLNELDTAYSQALAPYEGKSIVVAHEAYSYLCTRYGINQIAVEGVIPESEPSPEQMKNIINYIKENNIKYIFFEELLSPKVVNTISEETGATLLELNPFEGLEQEDIDAGADYISVMYENLENIKIALN
jgi:zinc transport system substrate-binding protein